MSGGDGGTNETDDPTSKESRECEGISEWVYYSYGHGIQYNQHKEYVFRVGWMMWTIIVEESVMVMILLKQLM